MYFLGKDHRCQRMEIKSMAIHIDDSGMRLYYYDSDNYYSHAEDELFGSESELKDYIFNPPLIDVV